MGHAVCGVASCGEDVIDRATESRPNLVLLDIGLKGDLDGPEAAEHMRAGQRVPVVFLTTWANGHTLRRAKNIGRCHHLSKPLEEETRRTVIEIAVR